jgi:hypothetical protein
MRCHRELETASHDGYMPLFDAVAWFATAGHTRKLTTARWDDAATAIIAKIQAGALHIWGVRNGHRELQIRPVDFSGLDLMGDRHGLNRYLELIGPAEHDTPKGGRYQDNLYHDGVQLPSWTGLRINNKELRELVNRRRHKPSPVLNKAVEIIRETSGPPTSQELFETEDYYLLPDKPPSGREAAKVHRALLQKYPDRRVPKLSMQRLADNLAPILKEMGKSGTVSRDAVQRALGKKE